MSAHTPGPWTVDSNGPGHEVVLARGGRHAIAAVQGPEDHGENLANARLIAAAPELLIALRVLIATSECSCEGETCDSECTHVLARAAIDKAEG